MDSSLFSLVQEQSKSNVAARKNAQTDDDTVDRLNRKLTPIIFSVFCIMLCAKQFIVGKPLQVWPPKEFSGDWADYATDYCWIKNTYYVPVNGSIPSNPADREKAEIRYYQWVPFVLALQALMFILPSLVWKLFKSVTGMDIKSFVNMAVEAAAVDPSSRDTNIRMIARHIKASLREDWDDESTEEDRYQRLGGLKFMHGTVLSLLYMVVKMLYVANIIFQFLILQAFLGVDQSDSFFGFKLLSNILNGKDWQVTGSFPRVTMCDFEINALGQRRKYSLQCVLVINLFNEKIYIFIWFWLTFIGIITILSLVLWMLWFLVPSWRQKTVYKYLSRNEQLTRNILRDSSNKDLRELSEDALNEKKKIFIDYILRTDGLFMLRMVTNNVGEPVVNDIIMALWLDLIGARSLTDDDKKPVDNAPPYAPPADDGLDPENDGPQTSST